MVFHRVVLGAAVHHAFLARVEPRERRLDTVGGVVREGQRDGARGGDGEQVAVADAVLAYLVFQLVRQARGEAWCGQVFVGIQQWELAALDSQVHRCLIRLVTHDACDVGGKGARLIGIVTLAQHNQRIAETGEAQTDATFVRRLLLLLGQRPCGHVQHVVQHTDGDAHQLFERLVIETRVVGERVFHHARQIDRAQAAAAVRGEGLFGARIRGFDHFAIRQVVVAVHQVDEQHARLGMVVGAFDDLLPQVGSAHFAIHPLAIGALCRSCSQDSFSWFRVVHQLEFIIGFDGLHQRIGHADGDVEVAQVAFVLGADEFLDVGMVATQHAHLRAAPRTGRFHRLTRTVEHSHVRDRAAGA